MREPNIGDWIVVLPHVDSALVFPGDIGKVVSAFIAISSKRHIVVDFLVGRYSGTSGRASDMPIFEDEFKFYRGTKYK